MGQALSMAHGYKPVDRDQLFLLPPDVRDWLAEDHLVFFVIEVLEHVDTSALHESHRLGGAGRQAYDPEMLLGLLVYAYCTGVRSSRRIEQLCEVDVAFRVIAANHRPDHSTVARFRAEHSSMLERLFTDVLALCAEAGLLSLGVIAVDGTKMKANASRGTNRSRAAIEAEVARILAEAEAVDAEEDALYGDRRGDELPAELADPRTRKARLEAALAALREKEAAKKAEDNAASANRQCLEAEAAAKRHGVGGRRPKGAGVEWAEANLARAVSDYDARLEDYRKARDAARAAGLPPPSPPGRHRKTNARRQLERALSAPPPEPQKALLVNTTDPDSGLMKAPGGWVQGYNAQAAVDANGVVLAATVTQEHGDRRLLQPMMAATRNELDAAGIAAPIGTMLFDAGYCSDDNISAPGPDRLIATTKSYKLRQRVKEGRSTSDPLPPAASPTRQMEHRLCTEEGMELYKLRQVMIEPAFGDVKENLGYRGFMRRGLAACNAEWRLICAAKNLRKLYRVTRLAPAMG
jgi:transposase